MAASIAASVAVASLEAAAALPDDEPAGTDEMRRRCIPSARRLPARLRAGGVTGRRAGADGPGEDGGATVAKVGAAATLGYGVTGATDCSSVPCVVVLTASCAPGSDEVPPVDADTKPVEPSWSTCGDGMSLVDPPTPEAAKPCTPVKGGQ